MKEPVMNKFIRQQLKKCRLPLPEWDDKTTTLVIPMNTSGTSVYTSNSNKNFEIQIKDYIINEPRNFTLSSNWNNGTKPPEHVLINVNYISTVGKMSKIGGTGKTTGIYWEGWLPEKGFEII